MDETDGRYVQKCIVNRLIRSLRKIREAHSNNICRNRQKAAEVVIDVMEIVNRIDYQPMVSILSKKVNNL